MLAALGSHSEAAARLCEAGALAGVSNEEGLTLTLTSPSPSPYLAEQERLVLVQQKEQERQAMQEKFEEERQMLQP